MPQSNQCLTCIHFWGTTSCDAFPDGIPLDIIKGLITHDKPTPEQENDIVYEERPDGFIRQPEGL